MIKTRRLTLLIFMLCVLSFSLFFFGCNDAPTLEDNRNPAESPNYKVEEVIANPTINIDFGGYTKNSIPQAVKGKEYKLFTAKAYDAFGVEIPVQTKLYLFYASENRAVIQINEGSFIPKTYGQYTVEFSATDVVGNNIIETYSFDCLEKEELSVELLSGAVDNCKVGDIVEVADYIYKNSNGFVAVQITAINEKETVIVENNKFVPRFVGTYTISYLVSDYCEQYIVSYDIDVESDYVTKFYGQTNLNKFYIVGSKYSVPEVDCVTYVNDEPAKVQPQVYVQFEGELPQLVEGDELVLDRAGKFNLIYQAVVGGFVTEKICEGIAVDIGLTSTFNPQNYFYSESNFSTQALSYGFSFKTLENKCKIDFVNPIQARRLNSIVGFNEGNNLSTFNIYLEDLNNPEIKVKLVVRKVGEQCVLSVNDGVVYEKTGASFTSSNEVVISYDNLNKIFSFGQASVEIKQTVDGKEFNGFTSGFVFISYEMQDVVFDSSFTIYKINNQSLGRDIDIAKPELIFNRYEGGLVEIGDIVTVDRIFVGTVFTDNFKVEYSIVAPDGKYVTDINGEVLSPENAVFTENYQFVANMIGTYLVKFTATTSMFIYGKTIEFTDYRSYGINVTDTEPPTIIFDEMISRTYNVGEIFTVPSLSATDNLTENIKVFVYIVDTDNVYVDCTSSSYMFKKSGDYQVKFMAMDEETNVSIVTFDIKVG